ncbi:MAG TPA: IPT/TIG domain-containing protein [Candidatus Binatia bacterium]|nr:IPT/TIG domain-containing protein [Candidatus Binatia bacterium]
MRFHRYGVVVGCLLVLGTVLLSGCNALNPLCGSARPAPAIGSLSPSTMNFSDVQQGATLTVNGSHFVSSSEVVINTTPVSATVVSDQQLKVKLSTDVISGPGQVKVMVQTPSGNPGDLGCSSGGKSSVLILTVQ